MVLWYTPVIPVLRKKRYGDGYLKFIINCTVKPSFQKINVNKHEILASIKIIGIS